LRVAQRALQWPAGSSTMRGAALRLRALPSGLLQHGARWSVLMNI